MIPVPTIYPEELWPINHFFLVEKTVQGQFHTFVHFRYTYILCLKIASTGVATMGRIWEELFPSTEVSKEKKNN